MLCPYCGYHDSRVVDSRDIDSGVRRRRQCLRCNTRFTTYETVQPVSLMVIKKDLRREEYNREKLLNGIRKACEKRPLPAGTTEKIVEEIENRLYQIGKGEVASSIIGEMVMEKLKAVDNIAYIRFASVYREFTDITALKRVVDNLVETRYSAVPSNQLSLLPEDTTLETDGSVQRSKK